MEPRAATRSHPDTLYRVLRALATAGVLAEQAILETNPTATGVVLGPRPPVHDAALPRWGWAGVVVSSPVICSAAFPSAAPSLGLPPVSHRGAGGACVLEAVRARVPSTA